MPAAEYITPLPNSGDRKVIPETARLLQRWRKHKFSAYRPFFCQAPYLYASETRTYVPDFIVCVNDGHGEKDLLNLIVEMKGCRREDVKEKEKTIDTYWIPGVNNNGQYGRWAFAEFTEVYQIQSDFKKKVEKEFANMIGKVTE